VAPYKSCEHPTASPSAGESLVSRLLAALTARPDVWAKTVFLISYDENDGYFDHVPPCLPALELSQGKSTVAVAGESFQGQPVGLGIRVPMLVISPWSKGGWVTSEVFDHTSVIRFLEARFGVVEPNITPWRRSVCGDLTSAFDFEASDRAWSADLPDPKPFVARLSETQNLSAPKPPAGLEPVRQEPGQRPARPLPYDFEVSARTDPARGILHLEFVNQGRSGAGFNVYGPDRREGPWFYTVAAGQRLGDDWRATAFNSGRYVLAVHGPNGFLREFAGTFSVSQPEAVVSSTRPVGGLLLAFGNPGPAPRTILVTSAYPASAPQRIVLQAGQRKTLFCDLAQSDHWYDLVATVEDQPDWRRRFAGHVETGRPSRSDPANGAAHQSA
jgi:phospholipase C